MSYYLDRFIKKDILFKDLKKIRNLYFFSKKLDYILSFLLISILISLLFKILLSSISFNLTEVSYYFFCFVLVLLFQDLFKQNILLNENFNFVEKININNVNEILEFLTINISVKNIINNFDIYLNYFERNNLKSEFLNLIPEDYYLDPSILKMKNFDHFLIQYCKAKNINIIEYFFKIEEYLSEEILPWYFNDFKDNIINNHLEEYIHKINIKNNTFKNILHHFNKDKDQNNNFKKLDYSKLPNLNKLDFMILHNF